MIKATTHGYKYQLTTSGKKGVLFTTNFSIHYVSNKYKVTSMK